MKMKKNRKNTRYRYTNTYIFRNELLVVFFVLIKGTRFL